MNSNQVKNILIVKIGAIGDVVMALSMIEAINDKYPGAEITWICGKTVFPLLKNVHRINNLIVVDEFNLFKNKIIKRLTELFIICWKLIGKRYDLAIVPYRNWRYRLLTILSLKKVYNSFSGRGRTNSFVPGRYYPNEYARFIYKKDDWEMPLAKLPKVAIEISEEAKQRFSALRGCIILAPGSSGNLLNNSPLRRWPVENYVKLTKRLISSGDKIIIIGSASESWVNKYFDNLPIINLIGTTKLDELVYLFNQNKLLITQDSGLMHLSKISEIKTVALFGPVMPREFAGSNEDIKYIWGGEHLQCSPCWNGRNFANCNNNICMKNITIDSVLDKVNLILFNT